MAQASAIPSVTAAAGAPTLSTNPLIAAVLADGWGLTDARAFVAWLCDRLLALGLPLLRLRVSLRILHPQFIGASYTWQRGISEIEVFHPPHAILDEDRYRLSPHAAILEGAGAIRRRLDIADARLDFPVLIDLKALGGTDYVALPLLFSSGTISFLSLASDRPGGFSVSELEMVDGALPVLAHVFEMHAMRATARTILDTYVGRLTGERVLQGLIRRGDGDEIPAVIWFCDLRGSTALAERLPRRTYIDVLNRYFECTAGAVLDRGGEVLSYVGDAVVAIFPTATAAGAQPTPATAAHACTLALAAAREAVERMAAYNAERAQAGDAVLRFGIALHLGDVMYGNIGVPKRLQFTVIGPAVNEAARLEALCKALSFPVLISDSVARLAGEPLASLGCHAFRGVSAPIEVHTLPELT